MFNSVHLLNITVSQQTTNLCIVWKGFWLNNFGLCNQEKEDKQNKLI